MTAAEPGHSRAKRSESITLMTHSRGSSRRTAGVTAAAATLTGLQLASVAVYVCCGRADGVAAAPPAVTDAEVASLPRYRVTELNGFQATGLNDRGQVVGYTDAGNVSEAVLWEGGRLRRLGSLAGGRRFGYRLNDRGQVTARVSVRDPRFGGAVVDAHAGLWEFGRVRDLGAPPDRYSQAAALNNTGSVVGWGGEILNANGDRALLWEPGKPPRILTSPGGYYAEAHAISDAGQIAGAASVPPSAGDRLLGRDRFPAVHAFFWDAPHAAGQDLGVLPGHRDSRATALNERGQVVGVSGHLGFLWEDRRGMRPLWPLPGHTGSFVNDIDGNGRAVGSSYVLQRRGRGAADRPHPPGVPRAILWPEGGAPPVALDSRLARSAAGWILIDAEAINERGQILAQGWPLGVAGAAGRYRCCLLTPEGFADAPTAPKRNRK